MRNNFCRSLVFFLLLVTYQLANAQVTPVQVTPQLVPPYSLQVSEYYSGSIPKIQVLLINRDINQPTIQVKLKMTVESQNCRLRTKEVNTVPAITLTNGVPYYLAPSELQALFSSANLDFGGGLSEQQYNQTLRLPEGLYTFTFEAYELYSGNLVSNKGFSMGWLTLADPPLLNTPSKGEEVTPTASQNIVFNWTPRHNTSPTAAYYTEYLFTLVEYNDAALSPEAAFASSNPILQKTVSTTSMLFSNQEPITTNLEQGKRYAWRVQAKAKNGAVEIPMFRNNGISEVHWFVYKNSCTAPQGITVNVQGQRATIEWQNNPLHLEWKVEYREHRDANQQQAEWFTLSNTLPRVVIMDLKPSTNYEYRVGGACYVNQFTYSPLNYFSTANAPVPPVVNCGDSTYPALGTAGLQTLNPGDTIRAGSFVVKVGYSTGSGSFTGTGYVIVPWLMNAKVEVKFTNITMSTDYKLVNGLIETTYDPTESGIGDLDEYILVFKDFITAIEDLIKTGIDTDYRMIKKMSSEIRKVAEQEMPPGLKSQLDTVLLNLEQAKTQYDSEKRKIDSLPPGPARDSAVARMESFKQKFLAEQSNLNNIKKQKEQLVSDAVDVIVEAVMLIKNDADAMSSDPAAYEQKKNIVKQEVYDNQSLILNESPPDNDYFIIDVYQNSFNSSNNPNTQQFNTKFQDFRVAKKGYMKKNIYKAFADFFQEKNNVKSNLAEDQNLKGRELIKSVMEKLYNNEQRESVKMYAKENLIIALNKICDKI